MRPRYFQFICFEDSRILHKKKTCALTSHHGKINWQEQNLSNCFEISYLVVDFHDLVTGGNSRGTRTGHSIKHPMCQS